MYFNLFVPFPAPTAPDGANDPKKKKDKGKGKAKNAPVAVVPAAAAMGQDSQTKAEGEGGEGSGAAGLRYWAGLERDEREKVGKGFALAGHLGYNVLGCTIISEPSSQVIPCPWGNQADLPFPHLDPRNAISSGSSAGATPSPAGKVVQVSRFHMRLDDMKTHCFSASNTSSLRDYDILSVSPTSDKALQLACTDLSLPGPNQISIISLPLHEKPYHFRLNRRQIRQAQRNGVVFELLYGPLFPPSHIPSEIARRWRQNVISNAREVIRITEGKSVIFSSGPGGGEGGMRGPIDLINLACVLGMPANLAKDSVSLNGKMVLLRAQARRTFKGVFGMPKMVVGPSVAQASSQDTATFKGQDSEVPLKRPLIVDNEEGRKKPKNA